MSTTTKRYCSSCMAVVAATQWHWHEGRYYCWPCLLRKRCPHCYPALVAVV